jgi:hypothetical protein
LKVSGTSDECDRLPRGKSRCKGKISHHRQSRWYEEGPLKGPSDEVVLPVKLQPNSVGLAIR